MAPKTVLKLIVVLMVMLGLFPATSASATQKTTAENGTYIQSKTGPPVTVKLTPEVINRIHSPEPIKKINAPQTLALEVEYQGNDAFIILGRRAKTGVIYVITIVMSSFN